MKKLVFLLLLLPCFGYAQAQLEPDTCFTQEELFDISETMDSLWTSDSLNNEIIFKQNNLIQKYQSIIQLDSLQLTYQKQQVELLQKNINLYVEREKRIQPKWYDNKAVWFGTGIVSTILTAKLIVDVVK
jgi:hypothetical protein